MPSDVDGYAEAESKQIREEDSELFLYTRCSNVNTAFSNTSDSDTAYVEHLTSYHSDTVHSQT